MSREILFRGKRIDNGEWIEGYLFQIWEHTYMLWGTANGVPDMIEVVPSTVGQYTGMTDKNGAKIFEGDIVYIWESMVEVYWRGGAWLLKFGDNDEYLYDISKDCEAIGNIHDGKDGRHDEQAKED